MIFHTQKILKEINNNAITVVAATKYFDSNEMRELFSSGITHFGENRVEAFLEKKESLNDLPITWHFIGTLQTKKVKKMINDIDFLHSLNTAKLALEIHKRRTKPLPCFIQVNISDEESKHGFDVDEVIPFIMSISDLSNVNIIGLMGMAAYTDDEKTISKAFQKLNNLQTEIKQKLQIELQDLSIGMSNDYKIAIRHHATYLRLGSVLFEREV